jgi:hypothetical protein
VTSNERGVPTAQDAPRSTKQLGRLNDRKDKPRTAATQAAQANICIHPLAAIFPQMEGAEFDTLVDDIKANGLIHPITMFEDMVLDGRNRLRAWEQAGVAPKYEAYAGGDPTGFVVSQNVARRHLNESPTPALKSLGNLSNRIKNGPL